MAITISTDHVVIDADGAGAISHELVMGEQEEQKTWLENATRFYAKGCRRRLLSFARYGYPIEETDSASYQDRLEVTAKISGGRSNLSIDELEYYIDHEQCDVEIDIQNSSGSSLATATESATTRAQNTGTVDAGGVDDLIITVRLKAKAGQTGKLYAILIMERDLPVADLPANVEWDSDRVAADASHNAPSNKRITESLHQSAQDRMPGWSCAWDIDNPLKLAAVVEKYLEMLAPLPAEARTLKLRLRYKVTTAAVNVRTRLGLNDANTTEPTSSTALAVTASRKTALFSVDIVPAHDDGMRVARVHVMFESDVDSASGNAKNFTVTQPTNFNWVGTTTSPLAHFGATECTAIRFLDVAGSTADINGVGDLLQGTNYLSNRVYFWPGFNLQGAVHGGDITSIELAPAGELFVYGLEMYFEHGTPYPGRDPMPFEDPDEAYLAVQGGQPLAGRSHRSVLYTGGQHLFESRVPVLFGGMVPRDDPGETVNMPCWSHVTFDAQSASWIVLGEAVVGPPPVSSEETFKRGRSGSQKRRRSYDVILSMLAISPKDVAFPIEIQIGIDDEAGSPIQTTGTLEMSLPVDASDEGFLRWIYHHDLAKRLSVLNNLQGALEPQSYGRHGLVTARLSIFDDDAGDASERVLQVRIRPNQGLPSQFFSRTVTTSGGTRPQSTPYMVMLTQMLVHPTIGPNLDELGA